MDLPDRSADVKNEYSEKNSEGYSLSNVIVVKLIQRLF